MLSHVIYNSSKSLLYIFKMFSRASKNKNFAEDKLRETLCEKIGVASPMIFFRRKKEKYILIWIDSVSRLPGEKTRRRFVTKESPCYLNVYAPHKNVHGTLYRARPFPRHPVRLSYGNIL